MTFPSTFLRGIPDSTFVLEDGTVATHLFYFNEEHSRNDDWIEQSINWEDNPTALEVIFNQRKENGELQFKTGVTRIPREEIDRLSRQPTVTGMLTYERSPFEHNPYHGNLLLRSNVQKPTMKKIAAGIALAVSDIIYRP